MPIYFSVSCSKIFIKELHRMLKTETSDNRKAWFKVGDYKKLPDEVGGNATCLTAQDYYKKLLDYFKIKY